jgi:proline iminopeptidase
MRSLTGTLLILACSTGLFLGMAFGANWQKQLKKDLANPDSNVRYKAVKGLDSNDPEQLEELFSVLKKEIWFVRQGAIEALCKANSEKALEKMKKELQKGSKPWVAEGIALSFGLRKNKAHVECLADALKSRKVPVRRSAAIALGMMPDKRAIPELLTAWKKEKYFTVWIHIKEALEKITGKFFGTERQDWANWWKGAQDSFEVGKVDKEAEKKAEEKGKKAKENTTVVRGVELNFKTRGSGVPLFVLPEYGYNRTYLETYLTSIEDVARCFYIDLPAPNKFSKLPAAYGTTPYYPVDPLVDAFDALRKKYNQWSIAILGHGATNWVAMRYATKYPNHVSHLILCSPYSSQQAFMNGVLRVEATGKKRGVVEQEHYAQCLQVMMDPKTGPKKKYEPTTMEEGEALMRMGFSLYFADPRSSYIALLWPTLIRRELGEVGVPPFDVSREKKVPAPTLVLVGTYDPESNLDSVADAKRVQRHYPNSWIRSFPKTRRMPFVEENEAFTKTVKSFFKKFPYRHRKPKRSR